MSAPPGLAHEDWVARITGGPFVWHIVPVKGLMGFRENWLAFGSYAHAERKARRVLARLRRQDRRHAAERIVQ